MVDPSTPVSVAEALVELVMLAELTPDGWDTTVHAYEYGVSPFVADPLNATLLLFVCELSVPALAETP